jgi:hypothetical protein
MIMDGLIDPFLSPQATKPLWPHPLQWQAIVATSHHHHNQDN